MTYELMLFFTGGVGGMGGAQPLAVTLNGGVVLAIDVDRSRIERSQVLPCQPRVGPAGAYVLKLERHPCYCR